MKKKTIHLIALSALSPLISGYLHSVPPQELPCELYRTCPCNQVPYISEDADTDLYIKKFKEASPRSQRAQLSGFAKQYMQNRHESIEAVVLGCARIYSERVRDDELYKLVKKLLVTDDKKSIVLTIYQALGKLYKGVSIDDDAQDMFIEQHAAQFKRATSTQQRVHLANYVAQYIDNPTEELEELLTLCAQIYCDRVQSQVINTLIQQLVRTYDKEAVQRKILQTLGLK